MMQEFVQAINDAIQRGISGIHTAMPGTIRDFDPKTGLASVVPYMVYRKPDGSYIDYPQITDVPVVFPQGNGEKASIVFPVKPGDGCLLIIAEKSLEYWLSGQITDANLDFDLTNAICIPGLFVRANADLEQACKTDSVIVRSGSSAITLNDKGIVLSGTKVIVDGDLIVNGEIKHTR